MLPAVNSQNAKPVDGKNASSAPPLAGVPCASDSGSAPEFAQVLQRAKGDPARPNETPQAIEGGSADRSSHESTTSDQAAADKAQGRARNQRHAGERPRAVDKAQRGNAKGEHAANGDDAAMAARDTAAGAKIGGDEKGCARGEAIDADAPARDAAATDHAVSTPTLPTPLAPAPTTPPPSMTADNRLDDPATASAIDAGSARARAGGHGTGRDMRMPARTNAGSDAGPGAPPAAVSDAPHHATPSSGRFDRESIGERRAETIDLQRATSARTLQAAGPDSNAATPTVAFARDANNMLAAPAASDAHAAQATLHAALGEPGFAQAFGTQVAVWVRDGVQEARLQLNPAELGPVTVQITLDGTAAQVDFTATAAATRESIEQSLPTLAAALRDSGFTLAGGGVHDRTGAGARQSDRREPTGPRARGRGNEPVGAGAALSGGAAMPRRWARSLVDVYA